MKGSALASLCTGIVAALVPKCPLCITAWLSVIGVGTGVGGTMALLLGPALWGITLLLVAAALLRLAGRVQRRNRRSIASPSFSIGKNDAYAKPSSG